MTYQKKKLLIAALITIVTAITLYSQQGKTEAGVIIGIDKQSGEILVGSPNAGDEIKMGDLFYVIIDGKTVQLRVIFPMMTQAKCKAEGKNRILWKNIKKGMIVYRHSGGISEGEIISKNQTETDYDNKVYKIGDRGPAGGWIFFDKGNSSDGWRYLEVAPDNQSTGIQWYNGTTIMIGNTEKSLGSGKVNTQRIISVQGKGNYAASICANYRGGGKKDWFLPSKEELEILYEFMIRTGIGGSESDYYWSSTEYDAEYAWYTGANLSYPGGTKYTTNMVRAIRAFGR